MNNFLNIDLAVQCVKTLVDNNRCRICDKLEGPRARYACGHTACDECVAVTSDCVLCLTPPVASTPNHPVPDESFTQIAQNALVLQKAFEDMYNIDIYKKHRLSEQLKIEKDLFPECIQAPVKYSNKRKSSNNLINKENRPIFLGEQISPFKKLEMEKTAYVQQWLERNDRKNAARSPRKVFADLNVNDQSISGREITPSKKRKIHANSENVLRTNRKRSHFKTTRSIIESQSSLDKYMKPGKKQDSFRWNAEILKKEFNQYEKLHVGNEILKKDNNDESGIVIDEEVLVINDSQSFINDKDKEACLAVLKADENAISDSTPAVRLECSEIIKYTNDVEKPLSKSTTIPSQEEIFTMNKVPFFKKSYLFESCKLCEERGNDKTPTSAIQTAGQSKDVSITIENNSFITTIKVTNTTHNTPRIINKHSTFVQTEIQGISRLDENFSMGMSKINEKSNDVVVNDGNLFESGAQSQDLFKSEAKNFEVQNTKQALVTKFRKELELQTNAPKNGNLIIAGSDSDDGHESQIIEVTADVHRPGDLLDYGVLHELDKKRTQQRTRPPKREVTPGSTDSSNKENYDPNRVKRIKLVKKVMKKKKKKKYILFKPNSIV